MMNLRLFLRHFKAGLSLAFIFCGLLAFGQYPAAPNKIGLGRQTTGDGLVFRTSGKPNYTPTTAFNAWMALDTTTGNLWTYRAGEWFLEVAGDLRLVYPVVINKSGVDIKQGQVVMIDTVQLVQGDQVRVRPAIATVSNSQLIMGVASTDINNDATGYISWFGYVREVDHADIAQTGVTLDVGDILYISATEAGKYTDTEPAAPNVNATIALVVRKPNANNMTLLVRPWLNEKLGDLRDVDLAGLQTGDGIKWNGTKWVAGTFAGADSTIVSAGYGIDVSEVSNNFTVSADTSELATPYDVSLKQDKLTGTGLVKSTSGTISYITDNSTNWDAAYNDRITSAAFSGSGTKTLTLTQQDAGTVTASFTDLQGVTSVTAGTGLSGGTITTTGTISADTSILSTKWYAADTASGVRDWVVAQGYTSNAGTVTSIATNNGITGGTITSSGTIGLTGQALALHNLSTNGLIARTGAGTVAGRTITAGTGISVSNGDGISGNPTITNSAPDQTVVLTAGTGINTSGTYPNFTITNSAPDQTVSITGAGINSVTGTYPNFTVTGTEVDGSVSNEGTLGVGAGGANTAVITSNTSSASGVTIAGGTNVTIAESTSSNGGTITINAGGGGGGVYANVLDYGASPIYQLNTLQFDTIYYGFNVSDASQGILVGVDTFDYATAKALYLNINVNSNIPRRTELADSTAALRAAFPAGTVTSIATNNGITGGTITTSGTIGLTGQALALHNLSTSGLIARTGAGTLAARTITAGTGISVSNGDGVSGNPTITNSAPDQTVVLTGGTGISTSGTYPNFTITNSAPDQTVSITGAGINSVTGTYPNFTITATEVDGSTTNELQTLSASSNQITLSNSGGSVTIAGAGINTVGTVGSTITVTGTEVDGSTTNEGTLGVGAGGANTAVITSNTSGANGVTIAGGSNIAITESASSNGGTVTIEVTGIPTTIYSGNGTLSAARTISTNGNKLTISGSNTAQVLEIDNTNTGTTTNALTLQSFGPPLQATRLTSSTGSILPVSDYYVNTSSTAAVGLGGFQRFYIEDAGGLNKEAGRIGFRTSDATGSSYDSEAFISVRKDSSELKEGFTLLSTGQLHLKEYGDTLFTGTAVKYLAVADDGKVIEVDGAAGTVKGTGAANKVAIWASADSLYQNTNLHWDNTNGRLGVGITAPLAKLHAKADSSETPIGGAAFFENFPNITANSSDVFTGSTTTLFTPIANTFNYNTLIGHGARAFHRGSGNVEQLRGLNLVARHQGSGIVSNVWGANFDTFHENGKITNLMGVRSQVITFSAADTLQNLYGIYTLLNSSNSETVNAYGVYVDNLIGNNPINPFYNFYGANNALNYFNGKTGLGVTSPQNRLDVEGGAAIGATYSGTSTAPTNGLLVEGKTLIGTTTGNRPIPLQVVENALIGGHLIGTSSTGTSNIGTLVIGREAYGDSIRANFGGNHVVVGYRAWQYANNNSGTSSVIIGKDAGSLNVTGSNQLQMSNCVVVGSDARVSSTLGGLTSNQIVIGESARGAGTNTTTIGSTSTTLTHLEGRVRTADYFDHRAPVTVTAATYTVGDATTYIIVNYAGTCNITLPTAADNTGRMLSIKTITANAVNSAVGVNNVVPIDGNVEGNTILPATDGAWAQLVCDGTNWIIMQRG